MHFLNCFPEDVLLKSTHSSSPFIIFQNYPVHELSSFIFFLFPMGILVILYIRDKLYKNRSSRKTDSQWEKRSSGSHILLIIVSENRFSGKAYFYTNGSCSTRRTTPTSGWSPSFRRSTGPPTPSSSRLRTSARGRRSPGISAWTNRPFWRFESWFPHQKGSVDDHRSILRTTRVAYSDSHTTLYVVSPWWNRLS